MTPKKNTLSTAKKQEMTIATKPLTGRFQNFGLSAEEFEQMLRNMQQGDDSLFERVFLAQFEDCMKYLMNRFKIDRSLAYDASMDALLKFQKRLMEGKIQYGNMRFLFTRMASQFLSKQLKDSPLMANLQEEEEAGEWQIDELEDEEVLLALDKAWAQLCDACSKILDHFYYRKNSLKELGMQWGKSEAAMRKQKQRCLEKLRTLFSTYYQP